MNDLELSPANTPPKPLNQQVEDARVLGALDEILASRPFKTSAQCSTLLRYVVEHTLSGEENLLRERVIGSEVFGRKADYEPGDDPVVRLRASEVRKRLAQFYQAEGTESNLRISIPPGSYRASFVSKSTIPPVVHEQGQKPGEAAAEVLAVPLSPLEQAPLGSNKSGPIAQSAETSRSAKWGFLLLLLAACAITCLFTAWLVRPKELVKESAKQTAFWTPLVADRTPIILCVSDDTPQSLNEKDWPSRVSAVIAGTATASHHISESDIPLVPYVDTIAMNKLTYWMGSHGSAFVLQRSSQLTIDELRRGPAILIGAFDNDWSLVLLSKLRFHVAVDPKTDVQWIEDSQAPGDLKWKSPGDVGYTASSVDYAIITKVLQPDTGKWLIAIGGLGNHGTEAAADLVTDKELSQLLPDGVLKANRNIQIVVRTNVINGHNSVPQIVATQSW
ncbi:MAG: hypothetical protein PW792_05205 [Acidobacteriaceae bacterium]|nr:hypothetical protein [Acidobacteriaceae bacterium]